MTFSNIKLKGKPANINTFKRILYMYNKQSYKSLFKSKSLLHFTEEDLTIDTTNYINKANVEFVSDDARLRPGQSEVFRLWCDNQKIQQLTGYQAQVGLREGLTKTIEWFTQPHNLAKYKTGIYNV